MYINAIVRCNLYNPFFVSGVFTKFHCNTYKYMMKMEKKKKENLIRHLENKIAYQISSSPFRPCGDRQYMKH